MHSVCQQIWKTQQWPQDLKRPIFIPVSRKGSAIECSNYHTIAIISHASRAVLKILQARLQQYVNQELPDVQAGFRKGRGTRKNCQYLLHNSKSKGIQEKISASLTMLKPLTVWITTNWKIPKEMGILDQITCLLINLYAGQEATEPDMEQRTGSKLGKEYIKAVYCHSVYLASMQSTSCKMPGWMKYKLESRLPGEISRTSDTQMTRPLWQKAKN